MTTITHTTASASARDYAWLQASVANWLHRTDLGSVIPDFVMLAEKRINEELKARNQDSTITLSAIAATRDVPLPADFDAVKALTVTGAGELDYLDPASFSARYASTTSGMPLHYTLVGNLLRLGPTPDAAYSLELLYRAGVPALADANGTNWLIVQHPDVYLSATMIEALLYTKDAAARAEWETRYATAVNGLNQNDWNAAGPLAVRTGTATP